MLYSSKFSTMGCIYSRKSRHTTKMGKHMIPFLDVEVYVNANDSCSFSGITCINGGKIIVADYVSQNVKYYNWKLLRLLDFMQLSSPPYGVCGPAVNDADVFVTLPFDNKILHVRLCDDKMECLREISTEGRCYGIASFVGGLAVSLRIDQHIWQIEILDYAGTVLKVFKDDANGRELFGFADYITADKDGTRLYVSDGHTNKILCYDLKNSTMISTREIYRYTDPHLKVPKDLTLDDLGNLYVIGCESCNLHKISCNGEKLGVVLGHKDQLENPMGIAYDSAEKKVFVTEGSRKVMIFKEP